MGSSQRHLAGGIVNIREKVYFWLYIHIKYGFHFKHPLYPLRVVRNIIKAKWCYMPKNKKSGIRGIDFAVTYTCNFDCEHCYAKKLIDNTRQQMTIDDYRRVCDEAMRMGCICFSLQGGEVFTRKDWQEVVRAFRPRYNHILLTTNGSMMTEDKVKRLKKLGLDTLYFSVDSGIADEHDRFRRHKGSFEKIMRAVSYCKRYKIKVVFNTCVTKQNLYSEGLKRLLDYSYKNRILIETIFARCLGNYDGREYIMLDEKDIRYYYNLRKGYPFVVRDLDNNYAKWGCPAAKEVLYITAYGDVCPCPYSHISFGNIKTEPLAVIRRKALGLDWYSRFGQECLTARNQEFMSIYYPLIEKKPLVPFQDLIAAQQRKEEGV